MVFRARVGPGRVGAGGQHEGRRVAADLVAAAAHRLDRVGHLVDGGIDVHLVRVARRQREGHVPPVPGDQQPDVIAAAAPWGVRDVLDPRVGALEREGRLVASRHTAHDLEMLGQDRQAFLELRIWMPERPGLVVLEPGAEPKDQATAADRVQRRGHLRGHGRAAERRVDDAEADIDARDDCARPPSGWSRSRRPGLPDPTWRGRARRSRASRTRAARRAGRSRRIRAHASPGFQPSNSLK